MFHSSFVRKSVFYRKNTQYAYNFYGADLYVNVCRGVFKTQSNIYGGDSLQKSRESLIVDVRLGSKYTSGIGFTIEKVYRVSTFIWYGQSQLKKSVFAFSFLKLIKTCSFNSFMMEASIIKKPVHWFALYNRCSRHEWVNEKGVIKFLFLLAS